MCILYLYTEFELDWSTNNRDLGSEGITETYFASKIVAMLHKYVVVDTSRNTRRHSQTHKQTQTETYTLAMYYKGSSKVEHVT